MKAVTLSQAKIKLVALLNAAERGEHVLIKREGKRPVALVLVENEHLEAWPEIPVSALDAFAEELAVEKASGSLTLLGTSARSAAAALRA
jgi:antitoxin (DNA-binding transcriptional repressor) of toxin-antitoxin stability system